MNVPTHDIEQDDTASACEAVVRYARVTLPPNTGFMIVAWDETAAPAVITPYVCSTIPPQEVKKGFQVLSDRLQKDEFWTLPVSS